MAIGVISPKRKQTQIKPAKEEEQHVPKEIYDKVYHFCRSWKVPFGCAKL